MNGARVVPLLAVLWAFPMVLPRLRWRERLGLVADHCDRIHASEVRIILEAKGANGDGHVVQDVDAAMLALADLFGGPWPDDMAATGTLRVRAYGPGHAERDRCAACGTSPAAGLAFGRDGRRYCHGDDGPRPTCYMRHANDGRLDREGVGGGWRG